MLQLGLCTESGSGCLARREGTKERGGEGGRERAERTGIDVRRLPFGITEAGLASVPAGTPEWADFASKRR